MFRRLLFSLALVVVGVAGAAVWLRPATPVVEPSSRGSEPPEAARFHEAYQQALARRIEWNYVDLDLVDIARDLSARLELPIEIDRENAAELPWMKKLTLVAKNLSVRNGLEFLLQPTLLTFVPYDGKLYITSDAFARSEPALIARRYSVPDLRQPTADVRERWSVTLEPLQYSLTSHLSAHGIFAIDFVDDETTLRISGTLEGHARIESALDGLRQLKREHAADPRVVHTPFIDLQRPDATLEVRAQRADIAFEGSLEDWGRAVEKSYGLYVHLFPPVLIDPSVIEPRMLKGDLKQARVDEMLDHFLKPHGLHDRLRTDAIVVFVPFGDPGYDLRLRAFPVWDLASSLAPDARSVELEKLTGQVRERLQADAWDWSGGPGSIDTWLKPATLIVSNTEENLKGVAQTLAELRAARRK